VDQLATAVAVAITFGLVFGLGTWFFTRLTRTLATRLTYRLRWLALPITALISVGLFAVLRPLVVDKPMNPLVFVGLFVGVALLVSGATALAYTILEAGKTVIALLRGR
jgi:hypothetical protein